jgi:hypothetical protein
VTPHDKHDSDLGGGRQKLPRNSVTHDTTSGQHDEPRSPRDNADTPRPKPRRCDHSHDPARVVDNEAATSWPHGTESSYSAASPPSARPVTECHSGDAAQEVRIEFVQLDGPAGQALRRRQAQIMRKVLRWIAEHPDPANQ